MSARTDTHNNHPIGRRPGQGLAELRSAATTYGSGPGTTRAVRDVDLSVRAGELLAVLAPERSRQDDGVVSGWEAWHLRHADPVEFVGARGLVGWPIMAVVVFVCAFYARFRIEWLQGPPSTVPVTAPHAATSQP